MSDSCNAPCNGLHDAPADWHSYARQRGREWGERIAKEELQRTLPNAMLTKRMEASGELPPPCETPEGLAREMHTKMALLEGKLAKCEEYLELILEQLTK